LPKSAVARIRRWWDSHQPQFSLLSSQHILDQAGKGRIRIVSQAPDLKQEDLSNLNLNLPHACIGRFIQIQVFKQKGVGILRLKRAPILYCYQIQAFKCVIFLEILKMSLPIFHAVI
jgi:hypothetical protein